MRGPAPSSTQRWSLTESTRTDCTVSLVSSHDRRAGTVVLGSGENLSFDRALVALGRRPNFAGFDLHHVLELHHVLDLHYVAVRQDDRKHPGQYRAAQL